MEQVALDGSQHMTYRKKNYNIVAMFQHLCHVVLFQSLVLIVKYQFNENKGKN